ncbi:MAG: RsmB/NOP family class I SAM-dependent RNA methyltransferase [Desulfohalobiaceae bacterium]|nr:RsmB/NOP family class I SAM-dependent RNA methyltransferase [Desulfohalobiaceae bacterium]
MTASHPAPGRTFRLCCLSKETHLVESMLLAEGYRFSPLDFYGPARVLTREPRPLGGSLAASFGLIYIQDRSSMLPPLALEADFGETVLDMCASPGGKTGILSRMTGRKGLVLANEPPGKRLSTLRRNLLVNNLMNVVSSGYHGERFPETPQAFSRILLDVPCSGWGTAEKNPRVTTIWRAEKLGPLLGLQQRLLSKCAGLLAPGGRLLYSTCTTNIAENEDQVLWAESQLGLKQAELKPFPGFAAEGPLRAGAAKCMRIQGGASKGQSFFLAALHRTGREEAQGRAAAAASPRSSSPENPFAHRVCFSRLPEGGVREVKRCLEFVPEAALRELPEEIKWQGFYLGKKRGTSLVSARARLLLPPRGQGPELVLENVEQLRQLLSGQSFRTPGAPKQRFLGLYYRELPLGWLSVKGSRCFWSDRT